MDKRDQEKSMGHLGRLESRHPCTPHAMAVFLGVGAVLLTADRTYGLDSCTAKLRRHDGVIVVSARSINGELAWASAENPDPDPLPAQHCDVTGAATHCTLSDPAVVPPPAPPSDCVVNLSDEAGECIAYVKGCVRGERRVISCLRVSDDGREVVYQGCNIHIRNDSGVTTTVDGTGNLIVGWNENTEGGAERTGSHNLIVGHRHSWTSFGGIVSGRTNTISGDFASVIGGSGNEASGTGSAVVAGNGNEATGQGSGVLAGQGNFVSAPWAAVAAGSDNHATGEAAFVAGGVGNTASQTYATVAGGASNEAQGDSSMVAGGLANVAVGLGSIVAGGENNLAGDEESFASAVLGGQDNKALQSDSTVAGGAGNVASGFYSTVSGGRTNEAEGEYSAISGGLERKASGDLDWAAGSLHEDF